MPYRKKAKAASDQLARVGSSGLDLETFRVRALDAIRPVVPFDAAFWAVADPATLLFTRGVQEALPSESVPAFLHNEFMTNDINQFAAVAAEPRRMHTMYAATGGETSCALPSPTRQAYGGSSACTERSVRHRSASKSQRS